MVVKRGDIVLVPVPDTSGKAGKTRPALVVSSDHNNARLDDAILAVITTTTKPATLEPTQLPIAVATPAGKQSRLLTDSAVKCERLHTLLQSLIHRTVGSLSRGTMFKVNDCPKGAIELP